MQEYSEPEKTSSQTRQFGDKSNDRSKNKLFLLIIGLVFLIIVVSGFFLLTNKKPKNESHSQKSKVASSSAKISSTFCKIGKEFKSEKQGYNVCYPENWVVNSSLQPSDLSVGFDSNQVDETHPGTIFVQINNKPEDQSIQDISNNSTKFEYGKTTLSGLKGTQIVYTRAALGGLNPMAIDTVILTNDRTYTISLNSTKETYDQNKTIYDAFLTSWHFIKNTPKPPWANSGNILVYKPWLLDTIDNPVEISGEAIAFEGTVNIRIKDSSSHVLEEATTQTDSGAERSAFKTSVTFNKPATKTGTIEVYLVSPKDSSEQDKVTIPVTFK